MMTEATTGAVVTICPVDVDAQSSFPAVAGVVVLVEVVPAALGAVALGVLAAAALGVVVQEGVGREILILTTERYASIIYLRY